MGHTGQLQKFSQFNQFVVKFGKPPPDLLCTFLFVKSRVVHKLGVQLESSSASMRVCAKGASTIVYCCTVDLCSSPFPGTKGFGGCCPGSDSSLRREELLYLLETRAPQTIMKSLPLGPPRRT